MSSSIECCVCQSVYNLNNSPYVIHECNHTACLQCLKHISKIAIGRPKCPLCRKEFKLYRIKRESIAFMSLVEDVILLKEQSYQLNNEIAKLKDEISFSNYKYRNQIDKNNLENISTSTKKTYYTTVIEELNDRNLILENENVQLKKMLFALSGENLF